MAVTDDECLPPTGAETEMLAVLDHLRGSDTYRAADGDRDCADDAR